MSEAVVATTVLTFSMLAMLGWLLFWGLRTRQFHNIEEMKYRVLDLADREENDGEKDNGSC